MSAPGFEARADIRKDQNLCAFARSLRPALQALQLGVEIPFLSMSTHATIQNHQPSIEGSYDLFDFPTRNAHLSAHLNHPYSSCLDPTSDRDGVQPEFVGGLAQSKQLLLLFCLRH